MTTVGKQNKGETKSGHFAIASKSTLPKVTGGNCQLHPLFMNMKLKVSMYFFLMVSPTFVVRPPALLLTSLEKNWSARTNTDDYFDVREIFVLPITDKLKSVDWCFT